MICTLQSFHFSMSTLKRAVHNVLDSTMLYWQYLTAGPNTEADGRSAYSNVQVGERVPKKDDSKFIVVTTSSIMTPLLLL